MATRTNDRSVEYLVGRTPTRLKDHNAVTWANIVNDIATSGPVSYDRLITLAENHISGSKGAPYPYQFVKYCIKNKWLVPVGRNPQRAAELRDINNDTAASKTRADELKGAISLDVSALMEGALRRATGSRYERNSAARAACIEHYGAVCAVCGMSFETTYGAIGRGYIHVHHLVPLAKIQRQYRIDPIKDLRPVCPNCHAMPHSKDPPYSIQELRARVMEGKSET